MIIKLKELSISDNLKKMDTQFPISPIVLFDSKESYYKHICFKFNIETDTYHLRPSFFLSNFTDTCLVLKKEKYKTICYTKYFIIELEDAIQNNEIEILNHKQSLLLNEIVLDITSYKGQLIHIHENYNQGLITKEELISQVIDLNITFCREQGKWNHILKPNYFMGGIAMDIVKRTKSKEK